VVNSEYTGVYSLIYWGFNPSISAKRRTGNGNTANKDKEMIRTMDKICTMDEKELTAEGAHREEGCNLLPSGVGG